MSTNPTAEARASTQRRAVRFRSGDDDCAGWHYQGDTGACVVMAGGLAMTKEPATDRFAARFNKAGFSVLAFDFRRLGESGGEPRQVVRARDQQDDWRAAITFARTLPEVDAARVAIWGFSLSGGHVFPVAADDPELAAAIAHSPLADGPAAMPNALRHTTPLALMRLTARALTDAVGTLLGRKPLLIPLVGARGSVAALSTPDAQNGPGALNPGDRYPDWKQEVAASSALAMGNYRPGRSASRVGCPLLVLAYEDDGAALPGPALRAAERAPLGESLCLPGGHYEGFMGGFDRATEVQVAFLRRNLLALEATDGA